MGIGESLARSKAGATGGERRAGRWRSRGTNLDGHGAQPMAGEGARSEAGARAWPGASLECGLGWPRSAAQGGLEARLGAGTMRNRDEHKGAARGGREGAAWDGLEGMVRTGANARLGWSTKVRPEAGAKARPEAGANEIP